MIIPEDGSFRPITTSTLNSFNNIMIVKVDNNWKNPGETAYQLATLDRSKKLTVWPADNYVSKLIPGLPENKMHDEYIKESKSRKELNLSIKTAPVKPKLYYQTGRNRYHFPGTRRPNSARKNNWSDRSGNYSNRFQPKPDINPWLQPPQINKPCLLPDGNRNMNILPETSNTRHYNLPDMSNKNFIGLCPPNGYENIYSCLPNALPSSSNYFQNNYHDTSFNSTFEIPPAASSKYPNNYRQNSRSRPNSGRHYKNNSSNRGSRHDLPTVKPYNSYMENERDNSDINFMYENNYPGIDNMGRIPRISPNNLHNNYVSDSRHDPSTHSSFDDTYIEQDVNSSMVYDNVVKQRNNSNNTPYQAQYSHPQNNRKRWKNKTKFARPAIKRQNVNLNPRVNMNSSNMRENMNYPNPSENAISSNFREDVNSLNTRENGNSQGNKNPFNFRGRKSVQSNIYNKNQRKPWMSDKKQNFRQTLYNGNHQKAHKGFGGSNVRQ